jgi:chromosome partitioning protein
VERARTAIPDFGTDWLQSSPREESGDRPGLVKEDEQLGRILCVANQKGGVGKTTTAVNLAVALAKSGGRTLLVDLDPQCNATTGLNHQPAERHALVLDQPLHDSVCATAVPFLQLLPGSRSFRDVEQLSKDNRQTAQTLGRHLAVNTNAYDFVLIDCPPSLGDLTQAALAASTEVLMPIQCEYFAMEGLTQMIQVIKKVMQSQPGRLEFGGILLTMYDPRLELTFEVEAEVRDFFGDIVFDTVIPRDVAVSEAPSHGLSVLDYAPRSPGTRAYIELCMEVLDHEQGSAIG